jgi:Na+-transporting NADH:ubiquinone oxidoreductase subunit NqrC
MTLLFNKALLVFSLFFVAPTQKEINETINNFIQQGKSNELSSYFDEKIELKVVDKENLFSKSQAEKIIEEFFRQFPPDDFTEIKNNTLKQAKQFVSGRYTSGKFKFKISYLLKKENNNFLITQLRIEKPHEGQFH